MNIPITDNGVIRKFQTGATRGTAEGKLDFEGALSPLVLQKFVEFMRENTIASDGSRRSADNWQKRFGDEHLSICMKSAWRHFFDFWKEHRGYSSEDGIEHAICALMFNVMAYYHVWILENNKEKVVTNDPEA